MDLMYIVPCIIVIVEEWETNVMSQFIKFYFTSSMFNMFRILIQPSYQEPATFLLYQPATRIPPQPSHTETPTHIETRTHNQCGDTIEKSQAPDDGCINVRNMLSIEEVK